MLDELETLERRRDGRRCTVAIFLREHPEIVDEFTAAMRSDYSSPDIHQVLVNRYGEDNVPSRSVIHSHRNDACQRHAGQFTRTRG